MRLKLSVRCDAMLRHEKPAQYQIVGTRTVHMGCLTLVGHTRTLPCHKCCHFGKIRYTTLLAHHCTLIFSSCLIDHHLCRLVLGYMAWMAYCLSMMRLLSITWYEAQLRYSEIISVPRSSRNLFTMQIKSRNTLRCLIEVLLSSFHLNGFNMHRALIRLAKTI